MRPLRSGVPHLLPGAPAGVHPRGQLDLPPLQVRADTLFDRLQCRRIVPPSHSLQVQQLCLELQHVACVVPGVKRPQQGSVDDCRADEAAASGFREAPEVLLSQYEDHAVAFKERWFEDRGGADKVRLLACATHLARLLMLSKGSGAQHLRVHHVLDAWLVQQRSCHTDLQCCSDSGRADGAQASLEQIEQDFWDIVEDGEHSVQVLYGADLDTRGGRSGFPVKRTQRSKTGGSRSCTAPLLCMLSVSTVHASAHLHLLRLAVAPSCAAAPAQAVLVT